MRHLFFIIISMLLFTSFYAEPSYSQNLSQSLEINKSLNLTCPSFCTKIIIIILNKTFVPVFFFHDPFQKINCTLRPVQTGILETSKHELSCFYPLLNFSSQEDFDKGIVPVPLKTFAQFGNLSVDFIDYQKVKSELPFWQVISIILTIGIAGYIIYQKYEESVES